jgi:DNA polymerase-3 subunit alpha
MKAGAFDRFGDRSTLLHNIDSIIAYGQRLQKQRQLGQTDLFGGLEQSGESGAGPALALTPPVVPHGTRELLGWERELLGLFLTQQPLEAFAALLAEQTIALSTLLPEHDGKPVTVGGSIAEFREITTKNGQKMAFVKITDELGEIELILFPSVYQQTIGLWERDRVVIVRGKLNAKDRDGNSTTELKVLVDDAREVTHEQATAYQPTGKKPRVLKSKKPTVKKTSATNDVPPPSRVYVRLVSSADQEKLKVIKTVIDTNPGDMPVVLVIGAEVNKQAIRLPGLVLPETAIPELQQAIGADNVKLG